MIRLSYIIIERVEQFPSLSEFGDTLASLRAWGYEGVELNMTEWLLDHLDELELLLRQQGLAIPSFLTGEGYVDGLCLSSPESSIREKAVERLLRCVEAAKRLKCLFVVGGMQGTASDEPDSEVAQARIRAGLETVATAAEAEKVTFVIEPVNHLQVGFNNSVAEVLRLISEIGSHAIKPMVDTIHMNIEEQSLTQPIRECGRDLAHVHLCESNGGEFGTGHVDFAGVLDVLEEIGYAGWASVKVYRKLALQQAAPSSLNYLQGLLRLSEVH